MCKIKGGTFLIVIPHLRIAWSFHVRIQLTLEQILLPFRAAWHKGWGKASPQFAWPKCITGWGRFGAWREAKKPWLCTEAAPWNGEMGAVWVTSVSPRLWSKALSGTRTRPGPSQTHPCAEREGWKAPRDSCSHGSFLPACAGNSSADLSKGSHERAKLLAGASKSMCLLLASAYARAALCTLARIGTILSTLKNSSLLCLLIFLVYLSSHLPGMA